MAEQSVASHQFRMRGENMTRIETFVAAAFAFAVTMLVISLGSIPSTFAAFIHAVKQIPSFAASCAIIIWIWHSHAIWCRRYGLEGGITVVLSGVLIFLVLIYIYPLRLMMQALFSSLSGGYLPIQIDFTSYAQVRFMFGFYGVGFLLLCCNFVALYGHAGSKHELLELNEIEKHDTRTDIILWSATAAVCFVSLLGAALLPQQAIGLSGFCYFLLFPVLTIVGIFRAKQRAGLVEALPVHSK